MNYSAPIKIAAVALVGLLLIACSAKKTAHYDYGSFTALVVKAAANADIRTQIQKDAAEGNARAELVLGTLYRTGKGMPQSDTQAIYWIRKSAIQGNVFAQTLLGNIYAKGLIVPQNYNKAADWYGKAAKQGFPSAQERLGDFYDSGQGLPQNETKATYWYHKAVNGFIKWAKKDSADAVSAQVELGGFYYNGEGVQQDYTKATYWFNKAANLGSKSAQYMLGIMYACGQGVPTNYDKAMTLLSDTEEPPRTRAKSYIQAISTALYLYKLDNNTYPTTQQGLEALVKKPSTPPTPPNWHQYLQSVPKNFCGHPYKYSFPGTHGKPFDVWTTFPSNAASGSKAAQTIGNWNADNGYAQKNVVTAENDASAADFELVMTRCRRNTSCPYYLLSAKHGTLEYLGVRDVKRKGQVKVPLSAKQEHKLLKIVRSASFFTLADSYQPTDANCKLKSTNAPTFTVGVKLDGQIKVVHANKGCANVPPRLIALARRIDRICDSTRWTGITAPPATARP